jgi:hypothetical protein
VDTFQAADERYKAGAGRQSTARDQGWSGDARPHPGMGLEDGRRLAPYGSCASSTCDTGMLRQLQLAIFRRRQRTITSCRMRMRRSLAVATLGSWDERDTQLTDCSMEGWLERWLGSGRWRWRWVCVSRLHVEDGRAGGKELCGRRCSRALVASEIACDSSSCGRA